MKNAKNIMLVLLLFITACGPKLHTEYEYIAPDSPMGRACANDCLYGKQQCEYSCNIQQNDCETQAQIESHADYLLYTLQNKDNDAALQKEPGDFSSSRSCYSNRCYNLCENNYQLCFTNCGGQVITNTYCVARCE